MVVRSRKLRAHSLRCQHHAGRANWRWQETFDLKGVPSDVLPLPVPPKPPQTERPTGDQVLKSPRLLRTFSFKTPQNPSFLSIKTHGLLGFIEILN